MMSSRWPQHNGAFIWFIFIVLTEIQSSSQYFSLPFFRNRNNDFSCWIFIDSNRRDYDGLVIVVIPLRNLKTLSPVYFTHWKLQVKFMSCQVEIIQNVEVMDEYMDLKDWKSNMAGFGKRIDDLIDCNYLVLFSMFLCNWNFSLLFDWNLRFQAAQDDLLEVLVFYYPVCWACSDDFLQSLVPIDFIFVIGLCNFVEFDPIFSIYPQISHIVLNRLHELIDRYNGQSSGRLHVGQQSISDYNTSFIFMWRHKQKIPYSKS